VDRRDMRETLASLLALHAAEHAAAPKKEGC
jgi:hypothetical protein